MTDYRHNPVPLPPELPELPEAPGLNAHTADAHTEVWTLIARRARRRRLRVVASGAGAALVAAGVPVLALHPATSTPAPQAHHAARAYDGVCDTRFDQTAPPGDRITDAIRAGGLLISPPGQTEPAVTSTQVRARLQARKAQLEPGTQVRWGIVRRINAAGRVSPAQARWIVTTCGVPQAEPVDPRARPAKPAPPVPFDQINLVTDTGASTDLWGEPSFAGVCDARIDQPAPNRDVRRPFNVGEIAVERAPKGSSRVGNAAVTRALAERGRRFPGTQIRLAVVKPLHTVGSPRLRWIVTTCGLDGDSVRPQLPGVVNEALVFDRQGRLVEEHRSSAQSEATAVLAHAPALPTRVPTYVAPGPDFCPFWFHANPDFRLKATAAGYTDMQGCDLRQNAVVIFMSSSQHGAAAAAASHTSGAEYERQYAARFPYDLFTLLPAPDGAATAKLLRFLSPRVAEVELAGPHLQASSYKFDFAQLRWLPCSDMAATRQPCQGR